MNETDIQYLHDLESKIIIPQKYDEEACRELFNDMLNFIIENEEIHKVIIHFFYELRIYPEIREFILTHNIRVNKDPNHWIVQALMG